MIGKKVKDQITGYTGIIVAKVEYISGQVCYCVMPPIDKDGKMSEGEYIDEARLEEVE